MTVINEPLPFQGSADEAAANRWTHSWIEPYPGETPECMECCAKSWHKAASYPCGVEPPRVVRCTECEAGVLHEHTPAQAHMLADPSH